MRKQQPLNKRNERQNQGKMNTNQNGKNIMKGTTHTDTRIDRKWCLSNREWHKLEIAIIICMNLFRCRLFGSHARAKHWDKMHCHNDDWILNIHFDIDSDYVFSLTHSSLWSLVGFLSVRHQHIIIRYFVLFRVYGYGFATLSLSLARQSIYSAPGRDIFIPFFPTLQSITSHMRNQWRWRRQRRQRRRRRWWRHSSIFV